MKNMNSKKLKNAPLNAILFFDFAVFDKNNTYGYPFLLYNVFLEKIKSWYL